HGGAHEIRNHAAIIETLPGTIDVEGPHDLHRHAVKLVIGHRERLAQALRFVVAGARTGAGDEAAVVLARWNVGGIRVAVDLAGGERDEAAGGLAPRELERVAHAADVRIYRLQREAAVEGG